MVDNYVLEQIIDYACGDNYFLAINRQDLTYDRMEIIQLCPTREIAELQLRNYFCYYIKMIEEKKPGLVPCGLYLYQFDTHRWNLAQPMAQKEIWAHGKVLTFVQFKHSRSSWPLRTLDELKETYPEYWLSYLEKQIEVVKEKIALKRKRETKNTDEESPAKKAKSAATKPLLNPLNQFGRGDSLLSNWHY